MAPTPSAMTMVRIGPTPGSVLTSYLLSVSFSRSLILASKWSMWPWTGSRSSSSWCIQRQVSLGRVSISWNSCGRHLGA